MFLAFWLLSTWQSKSQTTNNQVWWLLGSSSGAPADHKHPGGGFSLNDVNFLNPAHEYDKVRSPSTFQYGILATHPRSHVLSWSRQRISVVLGMILLPAQAQNRSGHVPFDILIDLSCSKVVLIHGVVFHSIVDVPQISLL